MEIYERIWYIRKMVLKMTREQFGNALGVSGSVITNIELNKLARPEQKEPLYKLICKVFNLNYEWLTTGQGEIYAAPNDTFIDEIVDKYHLSDMGRKITKTYLELPFEKREKFDNFIKFLYDTIKEKEKDDNTVIDKAIDLYRQKYPEDTEIESAYQIARHVSSSETPTTANHHDYLDDLSIEELEDEYIKKVLEKP